MQKTNFKKDKIPFTQVANEVLNDLKLSAKAKGLYAYLYSKPEGWDFAIDRIANDFVDGRKSINAGLHELEEQGYLLRERQPTGRVIYLLKSQMPKLDIRLVKPNAHLGTLPKRHFAEMGTVSNKDSEVIKSTSNKDSEHSSQGVLIGEIIKSFEVIDPKNKTYYGNKTQRAACEFLIGEYGVNEVKNRIALIEKANGTPYFPTITTPVQLRDKWVQLEKALERAGKQLQTEKVNVL